VIEVMPGQIARKWPLAIRLLELLHKQPHIWVPYKALFLPERVQTEFTMTLEEVRDRLKLAPSAEDMDVFEPKLNITRAIFEGGLNAVSQLATLVLPGVAISHAELTWAFSVVQSRANGGKDRAELIPVFDMLNHAPDKVCEFAEMTVAMNPEIRARMATMVAPTQLKVAWVGPEPVLFRGNTPLGRLDDCSILLAPAGGLRAGEEACFTYHDTSEFSMGLKQAFLMAYGFFPPPSSRHGRVASGPKVGDPPSFPCRGGASGG
jgi:hypothetical protein